MASILLYGTLLLTGALPVFSSPLVEGRAECNKNNLNRCFALRSRKLSMPSNRRQSNLRGSCTIIPPASVTSPSPGEGKLTNFLSSTTTLTTTFDSTSTFVDVVATVTTTVPADAPGVGKRAQELPAGILPPGLDKRAPVAVSPPACMTNGVSPPYTSSQVSAACACLSVTASRPISRLLPLLPLLWWYVVPHPPYLLLNPHLIVSNQLCSVSN